MNINSMRAMATYYKDRSIYYSRKADSFRGQSVIEERFLMYAQQMLDHANAWNAAIDAEIMLG